jgi:hypothetical protein
VKLKKSLSVSFFLCCFFVSLLSLFPTMAKDTCTEHSGPPSDSTFQHLTVQPTNYTYTLIDSKTEQLEVVITGEYCTNWRDLDQTGTGWPGPSNYNWHDQDIRAPFQFSYDPNVVSIKAVMVELRVFDIDAPSEVDIVYLNDVNIRALDGVHDTWRWNTFFPSVGIIVQGENHIDIDVDTTHTTKYWAMAVDWIKVTIIYQPEEPLPPRPPPPPSQPQPVGGSWVPINKFELLAPWITLASSMIVVAASIVYVRHKNKLRN